MVFNLGEATRAGKKVFSGIKIADELAVHRMTCAISYLVIKIICASIFIFEIFSTYGLSSKPWNAHLSSLSKKQKRF